MTSKRTTACGLALTMVLAAWACPLAAAPGEAPADKAPKAATGKDKLTVVTAVTGMAQRRLASDAKAKWHTVKVGDVLDDLTVIRTGLGSKVTIRLGDRSEVTVRSATKVGIKQFTKKGNVASMRLGLKYGALRARVDASRGANDFRVSTPVATLSVRGSGGGIGFWADRGFGFHCEDGDWHSDLEDGDTQGARDDEWINGQGQRSSDIHGEDRDPGLGDPYGGLTDDEIEEAINNSSGRGTGFNAAGSDTTAGALTSVTPPEGGPTHGGTTPPPIDPPDPPPPIGGAVD